MLNAIKKIVLLLSGFFAYGLGITCTVNANLGLGPWDAFHQGLSNQFGFTMGAAIQIAGATIMITNLFLNEKIGWGTVGNVYFIGFFLDLVQNSGLIPVFDAFIPRLLMMIAGMMIISLATLLYLSAQLGSGPRDGLMVALTKRLKLPVGVIRSAIELTVLIIGYFMGGSVGWGTLIMAFGLGFFIQLTFTLFRFDVHQVQHRTIDQDIVALLKTSKSE